MYQSEKKSEKAVGTKAPRAVHRDGREQELVMPHMEEHKQPWWHHTSTRIILISIVGLAVATLIAMAVSVPHDYKDVSVQLSHNGRPTEVSVDQLPYTSIEDAVGTVAQHGDLVDSWTSSTSAFAVTATNPSGTGGPTLTVWRMNIGADGTYGKAAEVYSVPFDVSGTVETQFTGDVSLSPTETIAADVLTACKAQTNVMPYEFVLVGVSSDESIANLSICGEPAQQLETYYVAGTNYRIWEYRSTTLPNILDDGSRQMTLQDAIDTFDISLGDDENAAAKKGAVSSGAAEKTDKKSTDIISNALDMASDTKNIIGDTSKR